MKTQTIIVTETKTEYIDADLRFSILMNGHLTGSKNYKSYSKAKSRVEVLQEVFNYSKFQIVVIEKD